MHAARLAAAAMVVAALAASGCRRADERAPLVVVIGDAAPAIGDPLRAPADEPSAVLRQAVAQGLVRFDAAGQIEPGLAERWNVSDDGLSYIFRLAPGDWPDGRKIMARDVARLIERQVRQVGDNPTRDAAGAIEEVVAMTDRVVEIRLRAPRPNLLSLLAQPEFALVREGAGSGPFQPRAKAGTDGAIRLERRLPQFDGEQGAREEVQLLAMPAPKAVEAFVADRATLVLGGTVADLPFAAATRLPRGALRFDPVAGLFGFVPARRDGPLAKVEVRRILNQAIDRQALLGRLGVPGLVPRATVLEGGMYGLTDPVQPPWLNVPVSQRRVGLAAALRRELGLDETELPPPLKIMLPTGPGGDLILARLSADWGALGIAVSRAGPGERADLKFVDRVAPSDSPAWFLRHFRCAVAAVCAEEADELLDSAREAASPAQRAALLAQAARAIDDATVFLAIAAPIRWSLAGRRLAGFTPNRYARHPLTGLDNRDLSSGDIR
jgi:peptide/nickel transport system substrate-binding protein